MLDIAKNLELYAQTLSPEAQIASGIITLAIGLFLWLGGIGYTRILSLAVGALFGLLCCILLTDRQPAKLAIFTAAAAFTALLLERAFITLISAALAALAAFLLIAQTHNIPITSGIKTALLELSLQSWLIIAAPAIIAVVAGFYLWPLIRSLCSASLGTGLVFAGMIILLLFKGSAPVNRISAKPGFFGCIFLAMIAFGTIVQLFLTTGLRKKQPAKAKDENQKNKNSD